VRGGRFADDQFGFGFANSSLGVKVDRTFDGKNFVYFVGKNGPLGFDTWRLQGEGATGDDEDRWWVDSNGGISSGWGDDLRTGVRSFNQGASTGWARRKNVTIWLRVPDAPEHAAPRL